MLKLYDFQQETVDALLNGKYIAVLGTGFGKTAIAMSWLREKCYKTRKRKVLIITTATKSKSGDMEQEADMWNGERWRQSLFSFEVVSWHKLKAWVDKHRRELSQYVIVADEVQKIKGYTTGMGSAFRTIAIETNDWSGYTATPGDRWIDLMPYFVATGKIKNKTTFLREHCVQQDYKGYPEIVGYRNEETLIKAWRDITIIPDTTAASKELPKDLHKVIEFKAPSDYKKIKKNATGRKGETLDTAMSLCHYLRQICFTEEKQQWLSDFIENLGDNCIFFCNYIEEEERVCEIATKVLPKGARVWRIDGGHKEIPTKETIGKYDVIVAHYASGGEALNLQFMHYWCAVSPNYSYSTSIQARGRIKRIGQEHTMFFYYLKTTNSIESDIYKCLARKKDFSEKTWASDNGLDV